MRGREKVKKISIIFGLMLFLCLLPIQTIHAEERTVVSEYQAGSNITAVLYSDGVLELTGTGATNNWSSNKAPWAAERESISSIIVGEGITTLGNNAFQGCSALTQVSLSEGLTGMGNYVFQSCTSLTEIKIPSTLSSSGSSGIFGDCTNLTKVTFAYGMTKVPNYMCYRAPGLTTIVFEKGIPTSGGTEETSITEIGEYSFYECGKLETVTMPETLQKVGYRAFYNCDNLKTVVCGNNLTDIYAQAFYSCGLLSSVTLNEGLKSIANQAFAYCESLTEIRIPSTVETVGGTPIFGECSNLTKVTFAYGMKKVPNHMCYNAPKLTTVVFEKGIPTPAEGEEAGTEEETSITEIGEHAFNNCASLETILIPETVEKIGYRAFYSCKALKNVQLNEGLTTFGNQVFYYCESLTEIKIPSTLVKVDSDGIFKDCTNLTKVTFAYGMTKVPDHVCRNATGLTTIEYERGTEVPSESEEEPEAAGTEGELEDVIDGTTSVTEIGQYAFYGCGNLLVASLPESLQKIGYRAFESCTKMETAICGNALIEIGERVFYNCSALSEVTLNEGLKTIGSNAFYNCSSLTEMRIPSTIETVNGALFSGCTNLTKVTFAYGITKIPNNMCNGATGLTTVVFEKGIEVPPETEDGEEEPEAAGTEGEQEEIIDGTSSITEIGQYAFSGCKSLEAVIMPETLQLIDRQAFDGCSALKEMQLNEGLKTINRNAFKNCTSLTEIRIPSTLETANSYAIFNGCTNLTKVTFAYGMTRIPNYVCQDATGLTTVVFEKGIEVPPETEGGEEEPEAAGTEGEQEEVIDGTSSITEIGASAFNNCKALSEITLDEGLEIIGGNAFAYCTSLTEIKIPSTLSPSNNNSIFTGCTNLTKVTFAYGMTKVPSYICYGATALTTVVYEKGLPTSAEEGETQEEETLITEIGNYAFNGCSSLVEAPLPEKVQIIGSYAFQGCSKIEKLVFGDALTEIGAQAFYNCSALSEVTLNEGLTTIGGYAFRNCTSLTEMRIPSTLQSVNSNGIFEGCSNLTKVTFAYGMTRVPNYMCYGATALTTIVYEKGIPTPDEGEDATTTEQSSITEIGNYAFYKCSSLAQVVIPENVTNIGSGAYGYCSSLDILYVNEKLQQVASDAFYSSSMKDVILNTNNEFVKNMNWSSHNRNPLFPSKTYSAGANVGVKLYEDGLLLVDGYGAMDDFEEDTVPWKEEIGNVNSIIVSPEVTGIGSYALAGSSISYIDIADNITYIGASAFKNCNGLIGIAIGNGVQTIGTGAFYVADSFDTKLTSSNQVVLDYAWSDDNRALSDEIVVYDINKYIKVYLSNNVLRIVGRGYVPDYGYSNVPWRNESIKKAIICEGIKNIGAYCFYQQTGLEDVVFPKSMTNIGGYAFNGCTSLTKMTLDQKITQIGDYVFGGCTALEKISLGEKMTQIGNYAFNGCTALTEMDLSGNLIQIGSYAFKDCTSLVEVNLGENITQIGSSAFLNCNNLVKVSLDKTKITQVQSGCFSGCSSLRKIDFPKTVTQIGSDAFYNCTDLGDLELHEGITRIDARAFWNCDRLTTLKIPRSLNSVSASSNKGPFAECDNLKSVTFAAKCRTIPNYLFMGCTALERVVLQDTMTEIGVSAFYGCTGLTSIEFPKRMTKIGANAFYGCTSLETVEWGSCIETIDSYAFYNCSKLSDVEFSDLFTVVNAYVFYGTALEEVVLPYNVNQIGNYAFACDTLKTISIPAQTKSIYTNAFGNLTNLTIVGAKGSIAEEFANQKGYVFVEGTEATDLYLSQDQLQLHVNETYELYVEVEPVDAVGQIVWTSSNPDIVSVTANSSNATKATIRALDKGEVQITVSAGTQSAVCNVTVGNYVTSLNLSKEYVYINTIPGQVKLSATVYPEDAENAQLVWTTSDSSIAVVDQNGLVEAVGNGIARIVVRTADNSMQKSCFVNVEAEVSAQKVEMKTKEVFLTRGQKQLEATIYPSNASNQQLTWSTSNEAVVTVDENGMITAVGDGEAIVTASILGGSIADTCIVTVQSVEVPVTGVTLSQNSIALDDVTRSAQLTATVVPANASIQDVYWKSSDSAVATVDENGKVYAQGGGTAEIIAITKDGEFQKKCTVTVTELITKLEISPLEVWLKPEQTADLTLSMTPASKLEVEKEWYSTNTNVATVDQNGKVYAVANGEAYIKCHTLDGSDLLAACKVNVGEGYVSISSITLSHKVMNLYVGEFAKLTTTVAPANATRPALTYSSSNPQVAQVSGDGVITATQKGSATITVSSVHEPEHVVQCVVTVTEQPAPQPQPQPQPEPQPEPQPNPEQPETVKAPGKVTLKSVKAGKKQITVKWAKKSGDGYQIQYSTSKNFKSKKSVTIKSSKTVSKKIKKLKSKKTYYVRVRAYKKANGKNYYGAWSKVKKAKVK